MISVRLNRMGSVVVAAVCLLIAGQQLFADDVCCDTNCSPELDGCAIVAPSCDLCGMFLKLIRIEANTIPPPPPSTCAPYSEINPSSGYPNDVFNKVSRMAAELQRGGPGGRMETLSVTVEGEMGRADGGAMKRAAWGSCILSDDSPPCLQASGFSMKIDASKTRLQDQQGREIRYVARDMRVVIGPPKEGELPSPTTNPPADSAEVSIQPVAPPCGEYPPGTTIDGQTIRIPNPGVRVYFAVQIRNWKNAAIVGGGQPSGGQD